jgi:hypothetical protein
LARPNLTRSRTFTGLAIAALAFAACGHKNSTPTPVATATPVVTAGPSSSPCVISLGVAFDPDGGNGNGFHGVQVTHFEGNDEKTCAGVGPTATPGAVTFQNSVEALAFGDDGDDAVAIEANAAGAYTLIQDVFGGAVGTLVPVGMPYDVSLPPPTPAASSTATPIPAPLIPAVTSVSIAGDLDAGVALIVGPAASPPAIVALTSLTNAPPQYGLNVPFAGSTYTFTTGPTTPISIVRYDGVATTDGYTALIRGPGDLLSFAVTLVGSGYQFNAKTDNTTLGYGPGSVLVGKGNIAFDPADGSRAIVAGTTAGGNNVITLLTGLPDAITATATLTLPTNAIVRSLQVASNGTLGVAATNLGIFVFSGVDGSSLALISPFFASPLSAEANAIPYTNCNGAAAQMTSVYSVGLSVGSLPSNALEYYLVALGTGSGVACPSGNNASLVALPFNPATGLQPSPTPVPAATPTPGPSASPVLPSPTPPAIFVQNNMIAPPAGADVLIVH